jgi:hypothetical protein
VIGSVRPGTIYAIPVLSGTIAQKKRSQQAASRANVG